MGVSLQRNHLITCTNEGIVAVPLPTSTKIDSGGAANASLPITDAQLATAIDVMFNGDLLVLPEVSRCRITHMLLSRPCAPPDLT
jgi:hypothetical protein